LADSLYLSLWYSSFEVEDMLPHAMTVMRQFEFSAQRPGITYLALHPVSWNEPTILERRFDPGIGPEPAVLTAADLLHEDYAYVFEAWWDLWTFSEGTKQWALQPSRIRFVVNGTEFEDEAWRQEGHIQVDLGFDSLFLQEEVALTHESEERLRANVQKLVDFTTKVEKQSEANRRLLWSESDENLAQKLAARLQRVQ
jgi:hypothetical protein